MTRAAKCLLIGSIQTYSGKSSAILGIAHQLQQQEVDVAYGKPLGNYLSEESSPVEEDVRFITKALGLSSEKARSPLVHLQSSTLQQRMQGEDTTDYATAFQDYVQEIPGDLILLEGSGTLAEGQLFGLSIPEMAKLAEAAVVLVTRYDSLHFVDDLLAAQQLLGERLLGVLINNIAPEDQGTVQDDVKPFLEQQGIAVLGMLPSDDLLKSVSVRELAHRLQAKVLCREDRLDLLVQNLSIGAMNVNSALEYFRKGKNMAVITGGDRSDLQMAALETSTHCLILTGHVAPQDFIISRAEDLEVPILSVNLDTLTTVEIVDQAFGHVRLQEPIQVQCMQDLMANHFDLERLIQKLGLEPATVG